MKRYLIITNPVYTAFAHGFYANSLNVDVECIALMSGRHSRQPPPDVPGNVWTFMTRETFMDRFKDVRLRDCAVCFPGSDEGFDDSEWVNAEWALRSSNEPDLRAIRRHKSATLLHLQNADLTDAKHFSSTKDQLHSALEWAADKYPIYLKPDGGSGGDKVFKVHYPKELESLYESLVNWNDPYTSGEETSRTVVLQTTASGTEYKIDVTSFEGRHEIISMWKADRGYRTRVDLVDPRRISYTDWLAIKKSCVDMLDSLGVKCGSTLIELKFDHHSKALVVLEINFRLHGHMAWHPSIAATGTNHVKCNVASLFGYEVWSRNIPKDNFYTYNVPTTKVWLRNRRTRYIHFDENEIMRIGSVQKVIKHENRMNGIFAPSENLEQCIAAVFLQNRDPLALDYDVERLWDYAESRWN